MMADEDAIVLSFGDSLLRKSDLHLLSAPNWINDRIIGFCFEYFEREQFNHSADRISLISPSVAQFVRFATVEDLVVVLEPLHLPSKQYVFVPVNDNPDAERVGGTHWSLLVYVRSKQEFQHFDAFRGSNQSVARKLADRLQPFVQELKLSLKECLFGHIDDIRRAVTSHLRAITQDNLQSYNWRVINSSQGCLVMVCSGLLCSTFVAAPRSKLQFIEMECPQQENSYDCGMYVIVMAEHLIREFCECFSVGVTEAVNQEIVQHKRKQIQDLILELSKADVNNVDHHLSP